MPLSKFIVPSLVILLFHQADAQWPKESDDDTGEKTNNLAMPKRATTVVATALVIISCAPLMCVMGLYFCKICQARFCSRPQAVDYEANRRANIILDMLRREDGGFIVRRAVLENFFSDVSKCLTAKDLMPNIWPEFIFSPQNTHEAIDKNEKDGSIETGDDSKSTNTDESSLEAKSPQTLDIHASSNDSCESDEHEPQPSISPVRSLLHDTNNVTDNKHGTLEMTPLEDIIKGAEGNETNENDATDKLECGSSLEEEKNVCPICLEPYGEGDHIVASKHCAHVFHKSCIFSWLEQHQACPCCRVDMITDEEVQSTTLSVVVNQPLYQNFCRQSLRQERAINYAFQ